VLLQVTQSRQAVDVSDAVGLVKQLEALTGAVDYEAAIAQHSTGLEQLAASLEETKSQIDRSVHSWAWQGVLGLRVWSGQLSCRLWAMSVSVAQG
jgi:hypothetical protein